MTGTEYSSIEAFMRIGIDARKIRDFGIGRYISNLVRYLPEADAENEYVIFHYPGDEPVVPQTGANIRLVADTSPKYSLQELLGLPIKMAQQRLDLFHATHYTLPPIRPCKAVVTIHDVIHLKFPQYLPNQIAAYYARAMMWSAAHSASRVLTVSECSKQDIVHYLHVPPEKVAVTYNGIDTAERHAASDLLDRQRLRERFGISRPYLLYFGNCMPHKNLEALIRAFALLKRQPSFQQRLVLAGKNEKMRTRLEAVMAEEHLAASEVIFTGEVEETWRAPLYALADLFVYPSLYEGFGLQVLEAMAQHVPVVIANVSSLPEIAGDAALTFDPHSVTGMADAISTLLTDQALRARLIEKGQHRLQFFSWRELARQTVAVYKDVLRRM